jgi:Transcriptional regulators
MKIKAVDIARALGISKATVSLALNNKPGVNEQTKQMIFECKERLENNSTERTSAYSKDIQTIKVIFVRSRFRVVYEIEFQVDSWTIFERELKKSGYSTGITNIDSLEESAEALINECNADGVAGVILFATEMEPLDYDILKKINKPMVIYDNDFKGSLHHRVCIDNVSGIRMAVEYLMSRNCTQIRYLANEMNIYNFRQRREGFKQAMLNNHLDFSETMLIPMGLTIDETCEKMKEYLQNSVLPDAFIMENYQVSIGVMKALREKGIRIPEDISLIGVDEIPSYTTGDCKLTTVKIAHTDRATMVVNLLKNEIESSISTKFKILSDCQLIEGNSVR